LLKWLFLGLLGVLVAFSPAYSQSPRQFDGPALIEGSIRRLPPVEPLPTEAEQIAPPEDDLAAEPEGADSSIEDVATAPEPEPKVKLWDGSFELGLDGSEGNTETLSFRFGLDARRKTERNILTLDLDYRKQTDKYVQTANRSFFDWRYEQLFQSSPWTAFVHGTFEYDEFQAFDARVTLDIGLGYQLIDAESTTLAARFGGGFSHEIDSPDDSVVPEAVFGLDFEHRINDRQKFTAMAEYTPDMTGMNDFRLRSRASWEALIDREMNLSLKLSVLDRYDSTPHGAKRNDLDYSVVLLWKF
jgi:putative salt-induced outer membrane protein YdiY